MITNINSNKWRYERKFFISELNRHEIESVVLLHPALFSEIHHERNVNNIYFDSVDMANFFDNVDGNSRRVKFRIRWYGKLLGEIKKPVLEVKIKNGQLGGKLHYPLKPFQMDKNFTNDSAREIALSAELPSDLNQIMVNLNCTLLNSYTRKYFESGNKEFRITVDTGMKYINLSHLHNSYLSELNDYSHSILELKYDEACDDEAREITNCFPFRMTKSSKYVTGIEMLHGSFA